MWVQTPRCSQHYFFLIFFFNLLNILKQIPSLQRRCFQLGVSTGRAAVLTAIPTLLGVLLGTVAPSTRVSSSLSPCRRPVQLQCRGECQCNRMQQDDGAVPLPRRLRGAAVRDLCPGLLPRAEESAVPSLRLQPRRLQQCPV